MQFFPSTKVFYNYPAGDILFERNKKKKYVMIECN